MLTLWGFTKTSVAQYFSRNLSWTTFSLPAETETVRFSITSLLHHDFCTHLGAVRMVRSAGAPSLVAFRSAHAPCDRGANRRVFVDTGDDVTLPPRPD